MEALIAEMELWLPPLTNFLIPSGIFHLIRTVVRRVERSVVPLVAGGQCDPEVSRYLNRLSDFFFVLARWHALFSGGMELVYKKDASPTPA